MTDRDKESVLSDSYLDRHSVNVDGSTTSGKPSVCISERESKSHAIERKDKDGHRSGDKDRDRNRDRSKKSDSRRATEWSHGRSPLRRDHSDRTSNSKHERLHGQDSPSDSCKSKQRRERSASPSRECKRLRTREGRPLLPPPMFHSTPLLALRRLSSDLPEPSSAHLSFNQSQSSLPPLDLGGGNARPIYSVGAPVQGGAPSIVGPSLPSTSIAATNFSKDHIKQIFSLVCEGRHLKERITWEFVRLSGQEVLFHTQAQSTGHESLASRHPERFTTYYEILRSGPQSSEAKNKAMEEILDQASKAWLATNAALFKHVLDYEDKLEKFLNKTRGWIREQEERIWMKMFELMGEAGTPLCTSLDIMLHLLDTLPSFPENL